jgi:hypothetical protein
MFSFIILEFFLHFTFIFFFFFNDPPTTEFYTIAYPFSLKDALPISVSVSGRSQPWKALVSEPIRLQVANPSQKKFDPDSFTSRTIQRYSVWATNPHLETLIFLPKGFVSNPTSPVKETGHTLTLS